MPSLRGTAPTRSAQLAPAKRLVGVGGAHDRVEQRKRAVLELHAARRRGPGAPPASSRSRRLDRGVGPEGLARGDPEEQRVADLSGGAGDGHGDGRVGHRSPVTWDRPECSAGRLPGRRRVRPGAAERSSWRGGAAARPIGDGRGHRAERDARQPRRGCRSAPPRRGRSTRSRFARTPRDPSRGPGRRRSPRSPAPSGRRRTARVSSTSMPASSLVSRTCRLLERLSRVEVAGREVPRAQAGLDRATQQQDRDVVAGRTLQQDRRRGQGVVRASASHNGRRRAAARPPGAQWGQTGTARLTPAQRYQSRPERCGSGCGGRRVPRRG